MGVFDVRCGLSGLPTTWATGETCSMLLLEEVDGRWMPLTPPIRGVYDRYGRLELSPSQHTPLAQKVGAQLTALWDSGELTADFDDLAHQRRSDLGGPVAEFLGLGSAMVFNRKSLHLGGHRVLPALWLGSVIEAIRDFPAPVSELERRFLANPEDGTARSVFCDWLMERGRVALAEHLRREGSRGPFGALDVPAMPGVDTVVRWAVEQPKGLVPLVATDGGQFTAEEERAFAHEAWRTGAPALRRVIEGRKPKWAEEWRREERAASPAARRYLAGERYVEGERILHPGFGEGVVESVAPGKVSVRFGRDVRVLAQAR